MSYAFRLRINRARCGTLNVPEPMLDLPSPGTGQRVQLRAGEKDKSIEDCERLAVVGEGFGSEEDATHAGECYRRALLRTLARLRIGVDFGERTPTSGFFRHGLAMLEAQCSQRVLNDIHGLAVFPAEPWPRFASMGTPTLVRGAPRDRFERVFRRALATDTAITERERVAFEMFNASFFQSSAEATFLLRVIAIEALLEPRLRPDPALKHVEALIARTNFEPTLVEAEKDSLVGSLRWLRRESIRRTGMDLVESRLAGRAYLDRSPGQFFSDCYNLRSNMVHGVLPFPARDEIARLAGTLELFVADLLSGPLINIK